MIRHQAIQVEETDVEDGSMRITEYVLAFAAIVFAGILALIR
jgi:hypothetical protein